MHDMRFKNPMFTVLSLTLRAGCWYEKLENGTLVKAILDKIIYISYNIVIDEGISMHERLGLNQE